MLVTGQKSPQTKRYGKGVESPEDEGGQRGASLQEDQQPWAQAETDEVCDIIKPGAKFCASVFFGHPAIEQIEYLSGQDGNSHIDI